jgi:copper homeostasis protein
MPSLEIACFNRESAVRADQAGADRIELCRGHSVGGITPDLSLFTSLRAAISTHVNVMIRPHGNGFVSSAADYTQMEADIEAFASAGAAGFVFGNLTEEGKLDEARMKELVRKANGRPCTFHRAFDEIRVEDAEEQLERVIACGFKSLLTSGGAPDAVQGKERLKRLVERANGRIEVIVGGGVRSGNLEVLRETGARWFHSSSLTAGSEEVDGVLTASREELQALRAKLDSWDEQD